MFMNVIKNNDVYRPVLACYYKLSRSQLCGNSLYWKLKVSQQLPAMSAIISIHEVMQRQSVV